MSSRATPCSGRDASQTRTYKTDVLTPVQRAGHDCGATRSRHGAGRRVGLALALEQAEDRGAASRHGGVGRAKPSQPRGQPSDGRTAGDDRVLQIVAALWWRVLIRVILVPPPIRVLRAHAE